MENTKLTILSNLQGILTFKNVELLKDSFIAQKLKNPEKPFNINEEFGILEYYYDNDANYITVNFENKLKELLRLETEDCKTAIDYTLIVLDSVKKEKFFKYIYTTLDYILNTECELINKFPICKKPLEEIKSYLDKKYDINPNITISLSNEENKFKVRTGISQKLFKGLYDLTIKYDIIDDEVISEETFVTTLTEKATNEKIIFACNNGLTMNYLENISRLFDNLTGKTIESSNRFYTKRKSKISQTNYNKGKRDITVQDSQTLSEFVKDFNNLQKE